MKWWRTALAWASCRSALPAAIGDGTATERLPWPTTGRIVISVCASATGKHCLRRCRACSSTWAREPDHEGPFAPIHIGRRTFPVPGRIKDVRLTRATGSTLVLCPAPETRKPRNPGLSACHMVRTERLELSHLAAPEPKSGVSTNFTTSANASNENARQCLALRNMGWTMGLEPTTAGATILCSTN